MDVLTVFRAVMRRWTVVVPVILVTALAAYVVHLRTDTTYEAVGALLLTYETSATGGGEAATASDAA